MSADIFLKLDGIEGESKDSKHPNEIQLQSFSWGASNPHSAAQGTGQGVGKVSVQDLHFTKYIDKASPKLFKHCAMGEHINKGTLVARKAGKDQQEYLKVSLDEVFVTSYQLGDSNGTDGQLPMEQISLSFTKVEVDYKPQQKDGTLGGSVKAHWDVKASKGG
jgi:type VI secretion system secreted protein Hcp